MEKSISRRQALLAALVTLFVAGLGAYYLGCGSVKSKLVPVKGKVTVEGKPLKRGVVVFHPSKEKDNLATDEPRGEITKEGAYELSSRGRIGAAPGWYRVVVIVVENPPAFGNMHRLAVGLIDPKYANALTSGLEVKVLLDEFESTYELTLKKAIR